MGMITARDVMGIADLLENTRKQEALGKLPPGSYDRARVDVQSQYEYGEGGSGGNDGFSGFLGNPDPMRNPASPGGMPGNFERRQRMANSMANDAALGMLLGSERPRTKDDGPEGTYAMSRYPGIEHAINTAASGVDVRGGMMTPESVEERKRWAAEQSRRLGMDRRIGRDEWSAYRRGTQGMGARERRGALKGFLRG